MGAGLSWKPGTEFGRLSIIRRVENSSRGARQWECRCTCGAVVVVLASNLNSGDTRSCGCLRDELVGSVNKQHGLAGTPEHRVWLAMRNRCENPNDKSFSGYGQRGITICEPWHDFAVFIRDMGQRPSSRHSIERIDNALGYSPANCKWATPKEQARNRRTNCVVSYKGKTCSLAQLIEELNLHPGNTYSRAARGTLERDMHGLTILGGESPKTVKITDDKTLIEGHGFDNRFSFRGPRLA
jgi:hypothetical protein